MNIRNYKTVSERRRALEDTLHISLTNIGSFTTDEETATHKNCENMIGCAQIPIGVAGPLTIRGDYANGDFFLPLATTEGALVASVARGCKALNESGGVATSSSRAGQTRGPVFSATSLMERNLTSDWIKNNESLLKNEAKKTSDHIKLKDILIRGVSEYLFVRFSFTTDEAMGMNMVTIASQKLTQIIEEKTGAHCISVAGNFDIDKKPAWLNFINNRGFVVWAEAQLTREVVKNILKTTPEHIFEVWLAKCMIGSAMSGSLGFNAQYANIIAALFLATGQDPAHVVEGSMGITTTKVLTNGNLSIGIYLPALLVGTVGGGTSLATQKEALDILGLEKKHRVETFTEIIAGAVLAGEISLLSSLAENSLAKAHQQLGRGEKIL